MSKRPPRRTAALRRQALANCASPRDEVQRVAQIVLSVIQYPDHLETIDWQIARAIVADYEQRKGDHDDNITSRTTTIAGTNEHQ